jgi:hypothetical protein
VLPKTYVALVACSSWLKQVSAQATSAKPKHRLESRSQRTCRRRQQPSHDSDRSMRQRWGPAAGAGRRMSPEEAAGYALSGGTVG